MTTEITNKGYIIWDEDEFNTVVVEINNDTVYLSQRDNLIDISIEQLKELFKIIKKNGVKS